MPTYQYKREDGSVFDLFQGINDAALTTCPETGQKVQRVISGGGGVVYKGTGWYVTDYKAKKDAPSPRASKGEPAEGGSGSGSDSGSGTGSGVGAAGDASGSSASSATGAHGSAGGSATGEGPSRAGGVGSGSTSAEATGSR